MNRTPPRPVQTQLRAEVGYGCPVRGCRKPFLTWHHFDPPWGEQQHHNPEGMIALCQEHHAFADKGGYSDDELRRLKSGPHNIEDVRAKFPWEKNNFLVRLGGIYTGGPTAVVSVGRQPTVELKTSEDGPILLSFFLRSSDGRLVAKMQENYFQATPSSISDLQTNMGPTFIQIRFQNDEVGLRLSFARVCVSKLRAMLDADRKRAKQKVDEILQERLSSLPAPMRDEVQKAVNEGFPQTLAANLPEHLRQVCLSRDPVGESVIQWVTRHCADSDGRVPLLDFQRLVIHAGNRTIRVGRGLFDGDWQYSALFGNVAGAISL